MIKAEFGIIDDFNESIDYTGYNPKKYNCVAIDDDLYVNDWWPKLMEIDMLNVFEKYIFHPQKALSRWGITIIPPKSLPALLDIVKTDRRYDKDKHLIVFADVISQAISMNKYMIHYGI